MVLLNIILIFELSCSYISKSTDLSYIPDVSALYSVSFVHAHGKESKTRMADNPGSFVFPLMESLVL
jgi:hypothetical protein